MLRLFRRKRKREPTPPFSFRRGMTLDELLTGLGSEVRTVGIRDDETDVYLLNPVAQSVQFGFASAHFPMFRESPKTLPDCTRQLKVRRYIIYHDRKEEWNLDGWSKEHLPSVEHLKTPLDDFPILEVWVESDVGPKGDT